MVLNENYFPGLVNNIFLSKKPFKNTFFFEWFKYVSVFCLVLSESLNLRAEVKWLLEKKEQSDWMSNENQIEEYLQIFSCGPYSTDEVVGTFSDPTPRE